MRKKLLLKNAELVLLKGNKVIFTGELKGFIQRLSYTITEERYTDLLALNENTKYNIWKQDNIFRFIPKEA